MYNYQKTSNWLQLFTPFKLQVQIYIPISAIRSASQQVLSPLFVVYTSILQQNHMGMLTGLQLSSAIDIFWPA